jgi:hypothetical protein
MTYYQRSIPVRASFDCTDIMTTLSSLRSMTLAPPHEPPSLELDYSETLYNTNIVDAAPRMKRLLHARYPHLDEFLELDRKWSRVDVGVGVMPIDLARLVRTLRDVPFTLASFGNLYVEWDRRRDDDEDSPYSPYYHAPSFSDGHVGLGWGAAFRGKGHERLVSPNWLHGGPFKVWSDGDVSLVQFHALDADAETALAQAKPGHREIGITDDTGFLQTNFVYELDLSGLYDPATRIMKVVVLGRDIPNLELLEWAAVKKFQPHAPERVVNEVAYIFPNEAEAHANLHRLWRYGHQCWAIHNGEEVRLDLDYQCPDTTPAWAK